jgi:hypothetical protein
MFLIGMPRSGTKLLRGLLNQHPRVRIPTAETELTSARRVRRRSTGAAGVRRATAAMTSADCSKASCDTNCRCPAAAA